MKRIFSLLLLLLLCLSHSIVISASNIDNARTNIPSTDIVEKNLLTGEITYRQIPTTTPNSAEEVVISDCNDNSESILSPNTVFGSDDRYRKTNTQTYPHAAIMYLECTFPNGQIKDGTAWVIGNYAAATAGHNIYDINLGGWATSIKVWPGRNGSLTPYGQLYVTHMVTSQEWADNDNWVYNGYIDEYQNAVNGVDWGLIELNYDISPYTGVISFDYASDTEISLLSQIMVCGYPYYEDNADYQFIQYAMVGPLSHYTDLSLYYLIDTSTGQSGSPILAGNNISFGIHTGASYSNGATYNTAVRITPGIHSVFQIFIAERVAE